MIMSVCSRDLRKQYSFGSILEAGSSLMFMGPCIVIYFYSKTNKIQNFSSLLNIIMHVSDGISVRHQESKNVDTASGIFIQVR